MAVEVEEVGAVDDRDEQSGSESEDEYGSSGSESESEAEDSDGGEDPGVARYLERVGFDAENATESDPQDVEDADQFLRDVGAMDHFDEVTSRINPSEDPSLLNEDNKHYFVAQALGARRAWDPDDPQANFDALSGAAQARLEGVGVENTYYEMDPDLGGSGETGPDEDGDTRIGLKEQRFSEDEPDPRFVNTVYHESVHAEQRHITRGVGEDEIADPTTRRARLAAEDADENADIVGKIQDADVDEELNLAYYMSPSEQEAHQAGFDVGDMFQRVGAMHDELEARTAGTRAQLDAEADDRAADVAEQTADWQQNPLYEPEGGWQNNPLYEQPQGAQ